MLPLRDKLKSSTVPWVVYLIIVLCVAIFVYESTLNEIEIRALFFQFGVVPVLLDSDALWQQRGLMQVVPFVSSMFLHGGWMHILGNLWILWIFGDNVQDRQGPLRFTIFYLLAGIVSMAVHTITSWGSMTPTIGASGAIAGVMGAYLIYYPRARVLTLVPLFFYFTVVEIPAFIFLIVWFLLQFLSGSFALLSGVAGGIAWWAHIGGFAFGMLTAKLFQKHPFPPVDVNILAHRYKV